MARLITPENRKWWTLGTLTVALFMTMLDNLVVNVALPSIQRDLGSSEEALQWTISGYALTYGVLMLPGGKLADLFGRRRMFLIGLAIFTLASLACGLATNTGFLITARAIQGAGAGLMMPATLSIIPSIFKPEERGTAIGIWAGVSWMGVAVAPLVGGILTQEVGWEWIFFINIPVGVIGFLAGLALIPESRDPRAKRLDVPGVLLSGASLFALTFALIQANEYGWTSIPVIALLAGSVIGLVLFVLVERRQAEPMLPLSLFRSRTYSGAATVILLTGVAMFGVVFFVSIYLQDVLGYSAIETGATFMPMTALSMVIAPLSGWVADRIGPRWLMAPGLVIVAIGLVLLAMLDESSGFWDVFIGLFLIGGGTPLVMTPGTASALGSAPPDKSGVAAGLITTSSQLGGALGIALIGAIVISVATSSAAAGASGVTAFVDGFERGLYVAAGIALAGAVIAALTIGKVRRPGPPPVAEGVGPPMPEVAAAAELDAAPVAAATATLAPMPGGTLHGATRARGTLVRSLLAETSVHPWAPIVTAGIPWLVVADGPLAGATFGVEGRVVIGREGADLAIDDPEISRRHAVVRVVEGSLVVEDLNSLNGTWVNGRRIALPTLVEPGDRLTLGTTSIEVRA
jgi:EmrB/QacA subfamily drug resistance transporter